MSQSNKLDFHSLANRLRELINANCSPRSCKVSDTDTEIFITGGYCRMIPHTVIVLTYRFAMARNLLMFFDTERGCLIIH